MCIIYDIYYIQYIVYAHIRTVECECKLQSLYAQHSASAHPMCTQCAPGVHCTVRMHAHTDTKSTSSDGTGAGQKEILKNKNTTKGTLPFVLLVRTSYLNEHWKNNFKNIFSHCIGKLFSDFTFWIQGYRTVQTALRALFSRRRDPYYFSRQTQLLDFTP